MQTPNQDPLPAARRIKKRWIFSCAYVAVALFCAAATHHLTLRAGLDRLARSGTIVVEQSADRLIAQLESYRELTDLMARHPQVGAAVEGRSTLTRSSEFLLRNALTTGAKEIHALDADGRVLASSTLDEQPGIIGADWSQRADVIAAKTRRMGVFHSADSAGSRSYYFARSVLRDDASPQGYVVVKVNMDELESEWRIGETVIVFFDKSGVAFVSNRLELALTRDAGLAQPGARQAAYAPDMLTPFPSHRLISLGGRRLWAFSDAQTMPARALAVSQDVPLLDMTARGFLDISGVLQQARLQALLAAALFALAGLGLFAYLQGRQRMQDQLRIEAKANAVLEARVETRNAQLQRAQDDLVQASKLTALGEMSAGISHELNQPLSAIQNYSENTKKLIRRNRNVEAEQNLTRISEQIQRMGRIIHNLRGFARKETEPLENVDLTGVVAAATALSGQRALNENVAVHCASPDAAMWVEAGQVRLQQVIVNLLSNAMDALSGSPDKHIWIELTAHGDSAQLVVRDNGPGLADASRAFEPFYTTKEIGASKGLGLGLSISYGIVGSFGGTITAENRPQGGAAFTIILPLKDPQ